MGNNYTENDYLQSDSVEKDNVRLSFKYFISWYNICALTCLGFLIYLFIYRFSFLLSTTKNYLVIKDIPQENSGIEALELLKDAYLYGVRISAIEVAGTLLPIMFILTIAIIRQLKITKEPTRNVEQGSVRVQLSFMSFISWYNICALVCLGFLVYLFTYKLDILLTTTKIHMINVLEVIGTLLSIAFILTAALIHTTVENITKF